jgi:hypothetical protein
LKVQDYIQSSTWTLLIEQIKSKLTENLVQFDDSIFFSATIQRLNDEQLFTHENLTDGSKKGLIINSGKLSEFMETYNGTLKYTKLQEKIITDQFGFKMTINNFMFQIFNRKTQLIFESGLADFYLKNSTNSQKVEDDSGSVILNFEHLGIWFFIWFVCMSVTLFSFLIEVLAVKCCRR